MAFPPQTILLTTVHGAGGGDPETHYITKGAFADISIVVARAGLLDTSAPGEAPMENRVPAAKFRMHDSEATTEAECTLIADGLDRHIDHGQVSGIILDSVKKYAHFCRISAVSGGYTVN